MTLLIEGLCPLFTQAVLNQCHAVNLRSVADFVICDPEELAKKIQVPYKDILSIRHTLIAKYAAFPQNGESLHYELLKTLSILDTGSKRINKYLNGGIYTGEVTELYGSPGSGKTQFCLSLVSRLILGSKNTAIYLDTSNNFDAERLEQIMLCNSNNDQTVLQNLHNIKVKHIYDVFEFFDYLASIQNEIMKKENYFFTHVKLLIIDSITTLLSPCFGGIDLDGPGILSNVAKQLKILSTEHMLSIMVCNNTVTDQNCSSKPALGSNWKYVPSVSLCIAKINSTNHKINTSKSCRKGLCEEVSFHITDAGLND